MRVLVGVDLRDHMPELLTQVATWAARLDAVVDLLYAEGVYDGAAFITDPHVRSLIALEADKLRDHDAAQLTALLETLPEAHRGKSIVVRGSAAESLIEASPRYDAVMVGTHGRTGLSHFWLGSQAERVVRTCAVPVIVLRLPKG